MFSHVPATQTGSSSLAKAYILLDVRSCSFSFLLVYSSGLLMIATTDDTVTRTAFSFRCATALKWSKD